MSIQTRSATLADAILPKLAIHTYLTLIVALSLAIALFLAFLPSDFDPVNPLSGTTVLKDAAKTLGLVITFGLSLAFLGHLLARLFSTASLSRPKDVPRILLAPVSWPAILGDGVRIITFSLILALFARISIHFGDNPVPITGQTLAVLLTGAALGSRLGALSILLYLAQGSAGMHVYAGGGQGLFWHLASGGYLIGFVPAAYVVGFLVERGWNNGPRLLLAMLAGNVILYVPGLLQLDFWVHDWGKTFRLGLYPFIPGDLAKLYVASLAVPSAWAMVRFHRGGEVAPWR